MILKLYSPDGASASEKEVAIPQFEGDKGLLALKQVILAYQANKRLGTSNTLTTSTVHGTGKKPFRQKGTGRARQGRMNAFQHYHGAVAHGPHPRSFRQRLPRKMRLLALRRSIFDRVQDGDIDLIERFEVAEAKTRLFAAITDRIAPTGKTLIVDTEWTDNVALAARNLPRVTLEIAENVNALDFVRYDRFIISEAALERILDRANGINPVAETETAEAAA